MGDWFEHFLLAFIPLFVAIDPVGLVPIYLSLASNVDVRERDTIVLQALSTAFGVGVCFLFLGQLIFQALGITVADFQIAGDLILLVIAGQDLLAADMRTKMSGKDFGVVPLGMPMIAGPGMLTGVLTLSGSVGSLTTLCALVLNLALVFLALRFAQRFAQIVGPTALRAISRIVALLLAAIAVNLIRRGMQSQI